MSDAEGPAPAPAADEEAPGLAEAAGARLEALAAAAQGAAVEGGEAVRARLVGEAAPAGLPGDEAPADDDAAVAEANDGGDGGAPDRGSASESCRAVGAAMVLPHVFGCLFFVLLLVKLRDPRSLAWAAVFLPLLCADLSSFARRADETRAALKGLDDARETGVIPPDALDQMRGGAGGAPVAPENAGGDVEAPPLAPVVAPAAARAPLALSEPALAPLLLNVLRPAAHAVDAVGVAGAKAAVCAYLSGAAAAWTVEELLFPFWAATVASSALRGLGGMLRRDLERRARLADLRRQRGGELDAPSRPRRRRRPDVAPEPRPEPTAAAPATPRDGDAAPAAADAPDDDDDDASRADDDEPDAAAKRGAAFACGFVAHCACRAVQPALVAAKLDGDLDATWGLVFAPAWGVLAIFVGVATTLCNCAPLLSAGMPARVRRRAVRLVSLCAAQLLVLAGCSFLFLLARARAGKGCERPIFEGSSLGRLPLVSADIWTSDHPSERSRSVGAFFGTRARGTLTSKRR